MDLMKKLRSVVKQARINNQKKITFTIDDSLRVHFDKDSLVKFYYDIEADTDEMNVHYLFLAILSARDARRSRLEESCR